MSDKKRLAAVLERIVNHMTRFVVFATPAQPIVLALWVVHTYAIDLAEATPYVHVLSPLSRCGKSRLFEVLFQLVARAASGSNDTVATMFRLIDDQRVTLMLDEIDAQFRDDPDKKRAIRSILNAGYRNGPFAIVRRCEGPRNEVREYRVFGAKAFAGIDEGVLHSATLDRCIPIRLERRTDQPIERFRLAKVESEDAAPLREEIEAVVAEIRPALEEAYPEMPEELHDRAMEVSEPLLAIADQAGSAWGKKAREAIKLLYLDIDEEDDIGVVLLTDLQAIFRRRGMARLSSLQLCEDLKDIEEGPWATWGTKRTTPGLTQTDLARLLRPFRIRPKNMRLKGAVDTYQAKGYAEDQFAEAWDRYAGSQDADNTGEDDEQRDGRDG